MMKFVLLFALLVALATTSFAQHNETLSLSLFNQEQAQISLWLSAAAYCGRSEYKSHVFQGPTQGFVVTYVIFDPLTDTQGFVGYLPSDRAIYIAYRGSQDVRNWITNLDVRKTAYTLSPECNCEVHKGFFEAEQKVIGGVLAEVQRLRSSSALLASYAVKVTGHSLGGALAQLTSMDLVRAGIPASVYNFGQPRVGDKAYASFSSERVPTWRVTHNKDIVPHIPFTVGMDFVHACREEFEDAEGKLKSCVLSCEDPTCSNQFKTSELNVDDHLTYLGMRVDCEAVSAK